MSTPSSQCLAAAARGPTPERRGAHDARRTGGVLQSARRQLVALDSTHRPGTGARNRQLAAASAGGAAVDGRGRCRLRRASAWLRPRVARRLNGEGLTTLGELVAFCNRRGGSWWRSIPRIGPGRARAIVSWLRRQQAALQLTVEADVDSVEHDGVPLVAAEVVEVVPASEAASDPNVTENGPGGGAVSS